jgi:hypothetical protein
MKRQAVFALTLALIALPVAAASTEKVACPDGQKSLMTKADHEAAIADYSHDPAELDPVPTDLPPPRMPQPDFYRAWLKDRSLPMSGTARAEVLLREDGGVDVVLVPCASSKKAVKPIVEALSQATFNVPTQDGKPVKHLVVVPIGWRID